MRVEQFFKPRALDRPAPWTAKAEAALSDRGYQTVAGHFKELLGVQPHRGLLSQVGKSAAEFCLIHGLGPERLRKGSHLLTYWPAEAFQFFDDLVAALQRRHQVTAAEIPALLGHAFKEAKHE